MTIEVAINDNAYEITYEFREDNTYTWILGIKIWCPLSDEWLSLNLEKIPATKLENLYIRLDAQIGES